jgi:hypothetical protein
LVFLPRGDKLAPSAGSERPHPPILLISCIVESWKPAEAYITQAMATKAVDEEDMKFRRLKA